MRRETARRNRFSRCASIDEYTPTTVYTTRRVRLAVKRLPVAQSNYLFYPQQFHTYLQSNSLYPIGKCEYVQHSYYIARSLFGPTRVPPRLDQSSRNYMAIISVLLLYTSGIASIADKYERE